MGGAEGDGGNCDNHHQLLLLMSEDVLIQILLWLPVISLLRFKSVCKSWCSIIESPFFINLHHSTTPRPSSSSSSSSKLCGSSLLFGGYQTDSQERKGILFKLSGEEFEVVENLGRPPLVDVDEELKWWESCGVSNMVGCYNGIICLHDYFTRNVALWNPAIKQSRILPKPSNLLGYPNCFSKLFINDDDGNASEDFVGFGIDIKTNDYKVLLITTFKPICDYGTDRIERSQSPHARRFHVYSLSTDSWRCIEDAALSAAHPDLHVEIDKYDNQGLHMNGRYFFTTTYYKEEYRNMSMLLSFDFTGEIFRTIQPPFEMTNKQISVYFISFGEKVALVDSKQEQDYARQFEFDIWVLNEKHGVKESWSKFCTFEPRPCYPRCISNKGEFAIMGPLRWEADNVYKLQLLDLITGETKDLHDNCDGLIYVAIYKPSLIRIGGNGATNEKHGGTL